jgi:copper resistance protein C
MGVKRGVFAPHGWLTYYTPVSTFEYHSHSELSMKKSRTLATGLVLATAGLIVGWTVPHIELDASFPSEDEVLDAAPAEMWLEFSVAPDMERSSFSVRGPDGRVALGDATIGEIDHMIKATVKGDMPAGKYQVSWVAAPMEDHTVRGRYSFEVKAVR